MKKWLAFIGALFMGLSVAACVSAGGITNKKVRYVITVTVTTPEGISTGHAVREAGRYREPSLLPEQGGTTFTITKGEAIVVSLANRGTFLVLLGGEEEARLIFSSLEKLQNNDVLTLQPNEYPRLVYFKDLNDPMSVKPISQYPNKPMPDRYGGTSEVLSNIFGAGTKIESIEIAKTSEDLTSGISNLLPWLKALKGGYLHGGSSSRGAPLGLHAGDFLKGIEQ